ncbi:L-seryl-tRNA(Sec) selenium transferase [bacterium]|nr:L-seryl-tRNA(Sec) selenium transferase [bacterium]MBU1985157.1 L-seryl-tRNA(Sec) selenium transferase [bacterium]
MAAQLGDDAVAVGANDDPRRTLPAVDTLLAHPLLRDAAANVSPAILTVLIREAIAAARTKVSSAKSAPSADRLARSVIERLEQIRHTGPRRCINATGVILHTGLGRAPLSADAANALREAIGYCDLEINLRSGERGERQEHVEDLLRLLTGAEAALVVNNNAAALYLTLNALAHRREVIASRGQLIEIGGSFRLPDIMQRSGVRLVEVGTTNRTRISDYREAITTKTALLLRAHPSNYRIVGFTESVSVADLVALGRERNLTVVEDLGNGLLFDWTEWGLPAEENVRASLDAGVDLVLVSGDKVLGGPQAGIIVGRKDLVKQLRRSPLARVLRVDKLCLAAMAATLRAFLDRRRVAETVPVWNMLTTPIEVLETRAGRLLQRLKELGEWQILEIRPCESEAGSGTLPAVSLPSRAICALPAGITAGAWVAKLRLAEIPVIGTVRQDVVWFDVRTMVDPDEKDFLRTVTESLRSAKE